MSLDDELFQDAVRDPEIRRWFDRVVDLRGMAELSDLAREAGGTDEITTEMERREPGWTNGPAAAVARIASQRSRR